MRRAKPRRSPARGLPGRRDSRSPCSSSTSSRPGRERRRGSSPTSSNGRRSHARSPPPATPPGAGSRSTSSPLYAYVIAPFWWIHSTSTAYAAIKYANAVIMSLAAVPTYLLSRMLVSRRTALVVAVAAVAIPGMAYSTSIVPENLAVSLFRALLLARRPRPPLGPPPRHRDRVRRSWSAATSSTRPSSRPFPPRS